MILRAGIRGNGDQLAQYLITFRDNEHIEILEVDGHEQADQFYLQQTILEMQLNSELTRTSNAFFHTQINPAYGEDRTMSREDWYKAADILAAETGYQDCRRVIVLHTKKGRTHAHVVWERYNHETGKMVDNKNSRLKADAARPKIEEALGHKKTPHRNPQRPELKIAATKLWNETETGADFINAARKAGYIIAEGTGNRPFMIVDENGRSFDLVRQIDGVRTKEVRARLRHEPLMTDKQAIELIREQQSGNSGKREKQDMAHTPATKIAESFADNRSHVTELATAEIDQRRFDQKLVNFKVETSDATQPKQNIADDQTRKERIARQFADNDLSGKIAKPDKDAELQKIIDEQQRIRQKQQERKPRR
jgi:hypothetical protein